MEVKFPCGLVVRIRCSLCCGPALIAGQGSTSLGFPGGSAGKESTCNVGDLGLIPGLGRSPGEGIGYPLQYSGLENSMYCIAHRVTKSRTWVNDFHFHYESYSPQSLYDLVFSLHKWGNDAPAAAAKSLQSCPTLWDLIDGSSPGSLVPGIVQARILEWIAIVFSNAWKWKVKVKLLSCVWLFVTPWTAACQAPPGSSVHGIFQAKVLEWGAIAFSNDAPGEKLFDRISSWFCYRGSI